MKGNEQRHEGKLQQRKFLLQSRCISKICSFEQFGKPLISLAILEKSRGHGCVARGALDVTYIVKQFK